MIKDLEGALERTKEAARQFVLVEDSVVNGVLLALADKLEANSAKIVEVNQRDLEKMHQDDPMYDRVMLDDKRISGMAAGLREIAGYDSPIGVELESKTLENGLDLKKVTVPLGVVGAIFEARPNVIIDIFALCFKSKNACVMKGGSQCEETNYVLMELIIESIDENNDERVNLLNTVILLQNDRELVDEFLQMDDYVDVIVPRGSQGLIDHVRKQAIVPVIETGRGVCHTYVDASAKLELAREIVYNAKVSRPSVCNSLDTLLIHVSRMWDLPEICEELSEMGVEIYADPDSYDALEDYQFLKKAAEGHYGMEYLSLKMSIKVVDSLEEAVAHINKYGSMHSEAIVTEDKANADYFLQAVDAAAVYVNASTRFTDGGVYGLGAEVGISTQKLHARGPMGIKELTSYKWLVKGSGQVR